MRLANKVAVVTGSASGIGKAIAKGFAAEGAAVVIADLNPKGANIVVDDIIASGGKATAMTGDAADSACAAKFVAEAVAKFGKLDILVNNAGIILQAYTVDTKDEDWDRILRNNLRSCFVNCREAAKQMIAQGSGGRIINISSIHAQISEPQACAYTAAKGGIEAFSRTLATELAPHKVTVNCIEPGATYTELTVPMYTPAVKEALYQRIPMREIAQPEWIASGATYLASDEARYMTGQVMVIDGGYVMDGSLPGAKYWTE
jgi:NAD(P)-dependent dehydrogenase (short-subunit alcohol dehydrogenase family)